MYGSIKDDFKYVWTKPNNAVAQIILINVIVFVVTGLLFLFGFDSFSRDWFGLPARVDLIVSKIWTIVTYMFVHDGFRHILWNMLILYWFGKLIQEFLGSAKVIGLYVMGGLTGAVAYILAYNLLPGFEEYLEVANLVGASAGVFAIVIGAAVFMPNYTMFLMFIGPVKIKYIALVVVFLFLLGTRGANAGGEFAHLGGALMGWIYTMQVRKGNDPGAWVISSLNFIRSLFKPQPKIKVTHRSESKSSSSKSAKGKRADGTTQEEIDAILDKISQNGYESLSKEEKQKLFNASK